MRILVVEDSPPTRDLLRRSLEGEGHEVTLAARLSTGLKLACKGEFDVLVVDVMLPDGDGFQLCREARIEGIDTPILFLTARGDVGDRIAGLDAGGDDYLRKPFALAELYARIRALGRRRGAPPVRRLESGEACLDFATRRFRTSAGDIPLTSREWTVLESLAMRMGRMVRRQELLDIGWHSSNASASESLDVIVSRLRRKLTRAGGAFSIRTLRGEGYILDGPA